MFLCYFLIRKGLIGLMEYGDSELWGVGKCFGRLVIFVENVGFFYSIWVSVLKIDFYYCFYIWG